MPRYNRFRPDFEAPGPYVVVEKREGIVFENPPDNYSDSGGDEDDDFTKYRYYESEKVLGKLYRAIDERKIFREIQQRSAQIEDVIGDGMIVRKVWEYVQKKCQIIQFEHKLEWARDIRDM